MTLPVMQAWTPEMKRRYGREIVTFHHTLADSGLFTDAALARLLDAHPREHLDINTMAAPPPPGERWIAGDARGVSGADLVEAAHRGRIWMNARRAMLLHPDYRALFEAATAQFARQTGVRIFNAMGGILISAPKMGTFFHNDATETMLWHVRGVKRMHLFPATEAYLPEVHYEGHLLKENLSDLPYRPEMEAGATVTTLRPGDGLTWPLHWPHHVQNEDSFNVSVSIEYSTVSSAVTNGTYVTNGLVRRWTGWNTSTRRTPPALRPLLFAASRVLKRFAKPVDAPRAYPRAFDVSLDAPYCVQWRPGAGPAERVDAAA